MWALILAVAFACTALLLSSPSAAHADPRAAPQAVDPASAEQSLLVWVRADADNAGIAGVTVKVSGGGVEATGTTGADGKAEVGLSAPGSFTVEVDESTIPEGAGVPRAGSSPREIDVAAGNKNVPAFFFIAPDGAASGAAGSTPAPSASDDAGTSTGGETAAPDTETGAVSGTAEPVTENNFWKIFWPKVVTGLIFGLLLALAAIGLSLIYGTTGLNNFAHGELVTFGALMAYLFSNVLGLNPVLAIIITVVLGGAFGFVQDAAIWKPLRRRRLGLVPLMIVTIGLSLALRYTFQFIFGADRLTLPNSSAPFLVVGPVSLKFTDVVGAIVSIVLLVAVAYVLLYTKIGKATRAVSDNRSLAAASGIDVEGVIRVVWIGGAALAALSGVFIAYYQSLRWDTGASILLLVFSAVVLGGLGTAFGALIGSIVIGVFINVSTMVLPENMKYVAALVVMIVILLVRPQGILGRKDRIG
ncbi:ABC transporter permease subunit [Clavibacter sepedonicus]|uniref:branched-chain amino acid ABC transporter permease n=1 Tax=Clavibacter TaxID=1573 RepID=UPI00059DA881|nr:MULTISPECIES: branched-chain amino acid ABC transporter permease [Clavibacter]MBD5383055.1 branched-chain amino acid ABC transporter permease [Clavibacter sp.]OQJ49050.1 branched-chain amino acid ABC transporter permease [Clavibacter sepedonicus]OQJ53644.1 branched-chain amino acid ABC transporter permease [Clavibacter sepedonicus]UUK65133.1 branched-chain amino acid ABC transporter permease [Clavibacter sepedonicus]